MPVTGSLVDSEPPSAATSGPAPGSSTTSTIASSGAHGLGIDLLERSRGEPVSGDPRVRFYAGEPLELSDGSPVGTFCVIDYRPRLLDDEELGELRRLGGLVVEEMESTVTMTD